MTAKNTELATRALIDLYQDHRQFLAPQQWEWEDDRWEELVVAIFIDGLGIEPRLARDAVRHIRGLNLLSTSALARADDNRRDLLQTILVQIGIGQKGAATATSVLVAIARSVSDTWGGHIQRFLRDCGEIMAEKLQEVLSRDGLGKTQARKVARLWLQNAANLPILAVDDPHIRRFCEQYDISGDELLEIADRLDLNVAMLDDVLSFDASRVEMSRPRVQPRRRKAPSETKSRSSRRR